MDEQKRGIILNSIINDLKEKAKKTGSEESSQRPIIDFNVIINAMESWVKPS